MKILVIEDERKLAGFIKKGLQQNGHIVDTSYSGSDGMDLLAGGLYDLILLDLMLPGQSGYDILKNMAQFNIEIPVIILSALDETDHVIKGLDSGAIDYLRKPFEFKELLARIRAIQRHLGASEGTRLKSADLEMNLITNQVTKDGHLLDLTNKEFALLELFMRKAGKLITKIEILEKVWDINFDNATNVVEVHIYNLRKKIDRYGITGLIETKVRRGYRFKKV